MASTNDFIKLYSTVQTNLVGSTITTGFIPYISTAGRQAYSNTLSTLTVSTLTGVSTITSNVNCSTITASTINGTSATSLATTSYVTNAITLGLNQNYYTWTGLFGTTFASNTSYYNSYGRVITIFAYVSGGSNASAQGWVGGQNLNSSDSAMVSYMYTYAGGAMAIMLQLIVPPGKYYIVRVANGAGNDPTQTFVLY